VLSREKSPLGDYEPGDPRKCARVSYVLSGRIRPPALYGEGSSRGNIRQEALSWTRNFYPSARAPTQKREAAKRKLLKKTA